MKTEIRVAAAMGQVRLTATERLEELAPSWEELPAAVAETAVTAFIVKMLSSNPVRPLLEDERPDLEAFEMITIGDVARALGIVDGDAWA